MLPWKHCIVQLTKASDTKYYLDHKVQKTKLTRCFPNKTIHQFISRYYHERFVQNKFVCKVPSFFKHLSINLDTAHHVLVPNYG